MSYQMQFKNDTANAPNITWLRPPKFHNDLWGPVVSGGDNRTVMLPIECCRTEVNQFDSGVSHSSQWFLCILFQVKPIVGDKKHVFRFQIRVGHFVVMHEGNGATKLLRNMTNLK